MRNHFTSDANCIPDYRKHVGHDRVYALPFAAQPRVRNPVMTGTRTGSVCFAGTWYAHRHFARHDDAESILRPALDYDLHIFDRMANSENPNYRWPDIYLSAVRGALPYSQMLAAYKLKVLDKMRQGYDIADVPCELLYALIERAEAWTRLQSDEALFQREKSA